MNEIILDIIKFTLPALIVFLTVYVVLTKQAKKDERMKVLELKKKFGKDSLPIRFQAFERITLLLHRISPENLIPRIQNPSMDVKAFTFTLLKTIKSEFEHNITQQVYVSDATWNAIENYKNDLIDLIKEKSSEINPKENSLKLTEILLKHVIENPESLEYQALMHRLKNEIKELYI